MMVEEKKDPITLDDVSEKAEELIAAQELVAQLKEDLKAAQEREAEIGEHELPEMLEAVGMSSITTSTGVTIQVKETVYAKIANKNAFAAYKWLDENGHGGSVKRQVIVPFEYDDEEAAEALYDQLLEEFPDVDTKKNIHHSTLRSLMADLIEAEVDFPRELFGVFVRKEAKITSKR